MLLIGIDLGNDHFALASVKAAPGEFSQFEDTVMAILASITYADIVAFESPAGDLAFEYPLGWSVYEMIEGNFTITNGIPLNYIHPMLDSGQVVVDVATPPTVEWYLREDVGLSDDPTEAIATLWTRDDERELGEVTDATVGNYIGTRLDFTTNMEEGYILLLDVDGGTFGIRVMTVPGELDDFDAEVTAILESIVYTPVGGTTEQPQ